MVAPHHDPSSAKNIRRLRQPQERFTQGRLHFPGWLHDLAYPSPAVPEPVGPHSAHPLAADLHRSVREPIRVVSANLWHDWPRYRRLLARLEAFARLVETEQADIVLLQEVARTPHLHIDSWLAQRLGLSPY